MKKLIQIKELTKSFKVEGKNCQALSGINLDIYENETLGLVGESGCGKSLIAKSILRLVEPTSGEVLFRGQDLGLLSRRELKKMRRKMQIVFQDPYASLNPRMMVQDIVGEALDIHKLAKGDLREERIGELLELVGLSREHMSHFPHEFSGGQRQRIGIARALAVEPEFIICDEPISALDVSIQAQVVNLLKSLQEKMKLTYLFIAHDLSMIKYLSKRVAVMYLGNLIELTTSEELYKNPLHPYTQALLSSIPIPDPQIEKKRTRVVLSGEIPTILKPPRGCPFHPRCPKAKGICSLVKPAYKEVAPGHFAACHLL